MFPNQNKRQKLIDFQREKNPKTLVSVACGSKAKYYLQFSYKRHSVLQNISTMGLISDRRNKAKNSKNDGQPKMKKGLFGGSTSHMFPNPSSGRGNGGGGGGLIPKYPPGYYTTPVHHSSSWSHPGQPKFQPNVNPRYQTWVAPRKQPALGQLVHSYT